MLPLFIWEVDIYINFKVIKERKKKKKKPRQILKYLSQKPLTNSLHSSSALRKLLGFSISDSF